jgi:hypothetical protein
MANPNGEEVNTMKIYEDLLSSELGVDATEAALRLDELVKFLKIVCESGESLSPSPWVDDGWHVVLEDRSLYTTFLRDHGLPHVRHVRGPKSTGSYDRARALMAARYGELHHAAWPSDATAGCEGCSGDAGDGP